MSPKMMTPTKAAMLMTGEDTPTPPKKSEAPIDHSFIQRRLGDRAGRREAVGDAPEITSAMKRRAERALIRNVVNNATPLYPLPRFVLQRHKLLKKLEGELIGPGSYEHDYLERERERKMRYIPSTWDSCTPRFPRDKALEDAAKSGTAGIIQNAWEVWDEACARKKGGGGKVPLFQSTPCNFREKLIQQRSAASPSPATYNIKSTLGTSCACTIFPHGRGMYEFGSGVTFCDPDALDGAITGQFTAGRKKDRIGPGSYNIRTSLIKELNDRTRAFKGVFSKTPRNKIFGNKTAFERPLWPSEKEGDKPGPGSYNPYDTMEALWTQVDWGPFRVIKGERASPPPPASYLTAPDYYFYTDNGKKGIAGRVLGNGWKNTDFRSKTPQSAGLVDKRGLREKPDESAGGVDVVASSCK